MQLHRLMCLPPIVAIAVFSHIAPTIAQTSTTQHTAAFFQYKKSGSPFMQERFSRTKSQLNVEITLPSGNVAVYRAILRSNETVARFEFSRRSGGASGALEASNPAVVTVSRDTARVTQGGKSIASYAIDTGTLFYVDPGISLLEQLVKRALMSRSKRALIPVLILGADGGASVQAEIVFLGADSAAVHLGALDARFQIDKSGNVLGGSIPKQQLSIQRVKQ